MLHATDGCLVIIRRVHDGKAHGVLCSGVGTKGRLEGCDIAGNERTGVGIKEKANPAVVACL